MSRLFQAHVEHLAASRALSKAIEEGVDKDRRLELESALRSAKGGVLQARAAHEAGNMYPPLRKES